MVTKNNHFTLGFQKTTTLEVIHNENHDTGKNFTAVHNIILPSPGIEFAGNLICKVL
jgi:hypothetical protein